MSVNRLVRCALPVGSGSVRVYALYGPATEILLDLIIQGVRVVVNDGVQLPSSQKIYSSTHRLVYTVMDVGS